MHPLIRAAIVVVLVTGIVGANAQRLTPIRVIQTLPLTGPQASYGQAKADGAQAFDATPVIRDNVAHLPERTSRPAAPRSVAAVPKVRRAAAGSVANEIDDEWEEF